MKLSRSEVRSRTHSIPQLRFEDQVLTSFSGLVLFQKLFRQLNLGRRLQACVRHLQSSSSYGLKTILFLIVLHLLMGWRRLRDLDYYRDDPLVRRVLGLRRLPSVSTVTRGLHDMDARVPDEIEKLDRDLVLDRLALARLPRVTLDFDGSVISTKSRSTEGTAIGYNRRAKGERSYYPFFCTVPQLGEVLAVLHRPGNVHDSKGALRFVESCFDIVRQTGFRGRLEARLDSAHFSDETCFSLDERGIEFTVSVPFDRFAELKEKTERCRSWHRINGEWSYFEISWMPKVWGKRGRPRIFRVIVFRHRVRTPRKGPLQLDLFTPVDHHFEYKAVITNKKESVASVLSFHNGRGYQEGILGELKSQVQMGYIPTRKLVANRIYLECAVLAHNLSRELQMHLEPRRERNTFKRACLWVFETLGTFRKRLVQRAGRLTRPNGQLTLTVSGNRRTADEFARILDALSNAA